MKLTNIYNLPAPLVAAVTPTRRPARGTISVTELIAPPQIRALTLRHYDDITEDVSDRIWALTGSLAHQLLAGYGNIEGHQVERTLSCEIEGVTVTGTFDLLRVGDTLFDWKYVTVWRVVDGIPVEWVRQLNLYMELLRRSGGSSASALKVVCVYRDWSKQRAAGANYPKAQVEVHDVPLWDSGRATDFLRERIRLHLAAEAGDVPECTAEERWARPTRFALMKRGRKTAVKVFDEEGAARDAATAPEHYVEVRPGASVRCASYCRVAPFCAQRAAMLGTDGWDELEA